MNFLLDMGISQLTGKHLMNSGHDAVHLIDHDMHKFGDLEILKKGAILSVGDKKVRCHLLPVE